MIKRKETETLGEFLARGGKIDKRKVGETTYYDQKDPKAFVKRAITKKRVSNV